MLQEVSWLELPKIGDRDKGFLTVAEHDFRGLPFEIKRVVWLYSLGPAMFRGQHANRKSHQVFFCLAGSLDIEVDFGPGPVSVYHLSEPHRGLYMSPLVWRTLTRFTPGTVVLILSSERYDEAEYIRDCQEFLRLVKEGK